MWRSKYCDVTSSIVTFRHNTPYVFNSFLVSLEISVIINILYEMIKAMHAKMLNVIYLYWFHSDTSEKKI